MKKLPFTHISSPAAHPAAGMSLIELSIVLVVVGLIISMGMTMGPDMIFTSKVTQTKGQLDKVRQAIEGFALTNNRLPCPDTDNDGVENVASHTCSSKSGDLPIITLGLSAGRNTSGSDKRDASGKDAWGNTIKYAVFIRASSAATRLEDLASDEVGTSDQTAWGTTISRTYFCKKLTQLASSTFVATTDLHVANLTSRDGNNANSSCANGIMVPFALITSGSEDADKNDNKYDGMNDTTLNGNDALCFENPDRIMRQYSVEESSSTNVNNYDDTVVAGSFSSLTSRMNCKNN
ncbi:MAG: type II secretion system protein [Magnetococcales bacterium]|nr:type II secretion system protein [Magnetococcales bacterium]